MRLVQWSHNQCSSLRNGDLPVQCAAVLLLFLLYRPVGTTCPEAANVAESIRSSSNTGTPRAMRTQAAHLCLPHKQVQLLPVAQAAQGERLDCHLCT